MRTPDRTAAHSGQRSSARGFGASAPAELRGDVSENVLKQVSVVLDTKLARDREQQGVGCRNRLVFGELLYEHVRLGGIGAPKDRPSVLTDHPDLVRGVPIAAEVGAIEVSRKRKNAAAHRNPRLSLMRGFGPRIAEGLDLLALLDVEWLTGLVVLPVSYTHLTLPTIY